jgi:glycosyltransferase involved in cell wall biosynthesis
MIRTVYVLNEFPSKTEYFILNEIQSLQNENGIVKILALKSCKDGFNHYKDLIAIEVIYLRFFSIQSLIAVLFYLFNSHNIFFNLILSSNGIISKLKAFKLFISASFLSFSIRKLNIELVHSHFANFPTDVSILISSFLKIPYSFSAHANDIFVDNPDLPVKIKNAQFVITCTAYNKAYLNRLTENKFQDKIHLIYHGIDTDKWSVLSRKQFFPSNIIRVLTIGRLVEKKGYPFLIDALKIVKDSGYNISCVIVGEGPCENKLKQKVRSLNLTDKITFYGYQEQNKMKSFYINSDIFVMPSLLANNGDRDGLPNVLLEALATGLPVITTDISGIPELITHKKTGLLVPPFDSKAIADAIILLSNDTDLYRDLSKNGYDKINREFNINLSTLQLKQLFTLL